MCCVHNCLIRGLNSIYLQAPHVEPQDFKSFIGYAYSWYKMIHHHHDIEEKYFFAEINRQLGEEVMSESIAEHLAFHDGLERYEAYLTSLSGREQEFLGSALVEIIDKMAPPLTKHLHHEITSLMELGRFNDDKLIQTIWDKAVVEGMAEMQQTSLLDEFPFGFFGHDMTYEGGIHKNFPPVPLALKLLVRYGFSVWNWSFWKFAPCDKSGQPKELFALGNA
jgi:hemerythrin-like domain-containing protein